MPRKKRKIAEVVSTEQTTTSKVEKTPENDPEMVRQASKLSETIGKPNSKKRSETADGLMEEGTNLGWYSQLQPEYSPTDDKYVNRPDLNNRIGGNYRYNEDNIKEIKAGRGNVENKYERSTDNPNKTLFNWRDRDNLGAMTSQYAFDTNQQIAREKGESVPESRFRENQTWLGLKGVVPGEPVEPVQKAESLVNAMATDATNTVTDKAILAQIQNAKSPEEIAKIKADAEAARIEEKKIKTNQANQNSNLLQQFMGAINERLRGNRPSFDQTLTVEDVQRGVLDQYRNQTSQVPYAVVEKLGIQDYYPNAGRDIAVGTFSGSRIGSQTIYSGAGSLLPMGLYDARKRSLVEAAKAVQKKKDEFLQVPDAPQQFNADFQQAAYSELYDIGAKHGWNMNAIMKDKEAMQRVYGIKNAAKDLAYTDAIVNNIFETLNTADGKTASYVPEDILQKMIEYRQGKLDVDAVLSGKNNVLELAGEIRNYANGTAWADKNLAEWKSDPVSLPLNLKTDKEITMENLNEMNQTIEKAKVSGSYDSYITAVKKYFHLDPKVVDAWVEQNMVGATPEQKQKVVDDLNTYILAQMPPASIEEKIDNLKNDNYNYWAKRQDLARYDKERETIMTRAINTANEAKLKDKISAINNNTSLNTPEKKRAALMKAYRDAGFTPYHNKTTGEVYGSVTYSAADKKMNVIYPADRTQVWVKPKGKNQQYKWEPINKVLSNRGGYVLDSKDINELDAFQKGGSMGSINESRMYETYYDGAATRKVNVNNIPTYANSQRKGIATEAVGNIVIPSKPDENGNVVSAPGRMKIKVELLPETNSADRDALDAMFSTEKQKLSTDPTFNAGGPGSNF